MSPTKIDLIKQILRGVDSLVAEGTVGSAPDNSHFNDESLQFRTANQLEGKQVYNDGNPTTSSALIDIFVPGGNPTLSLVPSLLASPTGSYFILDRYLISELKDVAERAIKAAGKSFFVDLTGSLSVVATQYEYAVPSGFIYIDDMHFVPTSGTPFDDPAFYSINREHWDIEKGSIVFNPDFINLDRFDGHSIRIIGQGAPNPLTSDSDTYDDILENYLVAWGVSRLSFRRMTESELWRDKYRAAKSELAEERENISTGIRVNGVRV